jgi:hypothetical protein
LSWCHKSPFLPFPVMLFGLTQYKAKNYKVCLFASILGKHVSQPYAGMVSPKRQRPSMPGPPYPQARNPYSTHLYGLLWYSLRNPFAQTLTRLFRHGPD